MAVDFAKLTHRRWILGAVAIISGRSPKLLSRNFVHAFLPLGVFVVLMGSYFLGDDPRNDR